MESKLNISIISSYSLFMYCYGNCLTSVREFGDKKEFVLIKYQNKGDRTGNNNQQISGGCHNSNAASVKMTTWDYGHDEINILDKTNT